MHKRNFDSSKFKVTRDISLIISGWLLVLIVLFAVSDYLEGCLLPQTALFVVSLCFVVVVVKTHSASGAYLSIIDWPLLPVRSTHIIYTLIVLMQ